MLDLGEMHPLTAVFILLELMMLSVQLYFYLIWPYHRSRLTYLILLVLLIVYNVTGGFFPDPDIRGLSLPVQNIVAYGSGFLISAYFPYYFYSSFGLSALRFHAVFGAPLFLLLPYLIFFVLLYPVLGDLEFAVSYGLVIPGLYSPILLVAMFRAIKLRFSSSKDDPDKFTRLEIQAVYWAVSPWVLMCLFAYLRVEQWVEVLFTNTGFAIIAVLFLQRSGNHERMERKRRLERDAVEEKQQADFHETCVQMGLSQREAEVALRLCQGLEYKAIGEQLHISGRTVDTHAHRIYDKLDVKNKIELQQVLGFLN